MKKIIIIPARYGSSRYKGKPLVKILKREMVLRVADICSKVVGKKDLFIATDNKKISNVAKMAKYNVVMTSSKCLTGTDRVAEVAKKIKAKIKYPKHVICGYDKIHKYENPSSINLPKVVVNKNQELVYISRSVIPGSKKKTKDLTYLKQVCIYAFNKYELSKFYSKKKKGKIEGIEDIEILRFFDLGIKIKMIKLNSNSIAVDEVKDVKKAEKLIRKKYFLNARKR